MAKYIFILFQINSGKNLWSHSSQSTEASTTTTDQEITIQKKKTIFNFFFIYINYIKIREINLFILDIFQKKNFCGIYRNTKSISRKFYTLPFGFFSLFVECLLLYYLLQFPLPYRLNSEKNWILGLKLPFLEKFCKKEKITMKC